MRSSLIILFTFVLGVFIARFRCLPDIFLDTDFSIYILFLLMFVVGVSIGADIKELYRPLRQYRMKILLVPIATILGTLSFCTVLGLFLDGISVRETVAIGSGFGYYSLSAVFLKELAGVEIGTMALIGNLYRELFTLLFTPFLVRYFGKLAPISSAGATSMDTSLPIITRYAGENFVVVSLFHGIVVDMSVPVILSLLYLF